MATDITFDPAEVVEEKRFSLSNVNEGNNKFWNIVLLRDDTVVVHFGFQGAAGQKAKFAPPNKKSGRKGFDAQIREKTSPKHKGGPYIENKFVGSATSLPVVRETSSKEHVRTRAVAEIARGNTYLTSLVSYLTDVNIHQISEWSGGQITYNSTTGLFQTTQGVVTLDQIREARQLLDRIAQFAARRDFTSLEFTRVANPYLSLVPQAGLMRQLKAKFPEMFGVGGGLQHQNDMLDSLESSYATAIAQPQTTTVDTVTETIKPKLFKVDLSPVDRHDDEFCAVRAYYQRTKGTHADSQGYDVKSVFNLRIEDMAVAFLKKGVKVGNVMRLWHGTKASNVLSILKVGMMVPPASDPHVTARMFGAGLYFADQSTKSIRYATGRWGRAGVGDTSRVFMFLVDVAMGKPYYPANDSTKKPPVGYDSIFAKGDGTVYSMISGKLQNNEMIVPHSYQANPVYLVEF